MVRAKLRKLAEVYKLKDWPSDFQVSQLCQLAAGHLGLAATALRWIAREIEFEGRVRQDRVFDEVGLLGMGELDELYPAPNFSSSGPSWETLD